MSTLATFLLATAEAGEEETSKTAFYVGGSLLAVWAVLVSVIGMTQPSFPSNVAQKNAVIGISAVLTVVALVTVLITA